ncbi:hypothetical protein DAPPUDRAFT_266025 [Daphnia pulex]|uniref:Uncharacterized protein n=1 Tax=Daphnia pulex TaxID=6669 RepID=E9HUD3_DAPPU|nr:hypothetical protein DAPPUDRAFT_266025 [Daphnia pulex]|eukprot:EFX64642.1 hypothetical protein DAPPUDRAFT_266025 [Daphnia pulex]
MFVGWRNWHCTIRSNLKNDLIRIIRRTTSHQTCASSASSTGCVNYSMHTIPVNFTTEITICGAQPRFRNFTISRVGWELTTFISCYWTTGTVNFNDRLYSYRNHTWELVETSIVVPQRDLADAFRYTDVNFFEYQQKANPAYADTQSSPMDIIADLTASINEHSEKGSTQDTAIGASNMRLLRIGKHPCRLDTGQILNSDVLELVKTLLILLNNV